MSLNLEADYDSFIAQIGNKLGKIDTNLAMQTMYYERRFHDVEPSVNLKIHYKDGTNVEKKRREINSKYGYCTALEGKNGLKAAGLMNLHRIYEISNDDDIETITGTASCASY